MVAVREGALTSATDMVMLELHGPGGHTARPHLTVDLVRVAAQVAIELPDAVRGGWRDAGDSLLVFGALLAGDAVNVIPVTRRARGTFRTPERAVWAQAEATVA